MEPTHPRHPPATSPDLIARSGEAFGPRPEASALGWDDLLPVTRFATEELINWLHTAVGKHEGKEKSPRSGDASSCEERQVKDQLATSVLVAGDRGYGKTTILLTLDQALRDPKAFLGFGSRRGEPMPMPLAGICQKLEKLQESLVWLPLLDVEPLPSEGTANLLATLLVCAREAIDRDHHRKDRWVAPSLLEEGLDDPYGKIDKLIQGATFMWADRRAQDALQGASQDVKAAEIYTTFREDFFSAMECVSSLMAARRFGHTTKQKLLLVLPIDNVDRSTQHLASIIKLVRMVASPRLWFVLAAGRQEFQLFLERTFLKELTDFSHLPMDLRGEEDARSIARRQAAAAMHRVLPSAHQIKIEPVPPEEVWRFTAAPRLLTTQGEPDELWTFLDALPLPGEAGHEDGLRSLADLFDIEKQLRGHGNEGAELLTACRAFLAEERGEDLAPSAAQDTEAEAEETEEREVAMKAAGAAASAQNAEGASVLPVDVGGAFLFDIQRQLRDARGPVSEELVEVVVRLQSQMGAPTPRARRQNPVFTHAGRLALNLSARGALDLWQAAQLRVLQKKQHTHKPDEKHCLFCSELSIKLATTMLHSAIDESELPAWATEQLHNRILRLDDQDRNILDLTGNPVRRKKVTTLSDMLEWFPDWNDPAKPSPGRTSQASGSEAQLLRSELHLRHLKDDILELHDAASPGRNVPLPPQVAGWYMVLHDLLVLCNDRRVLNGDETSLGTTPAMAVTLHTAKLPNLGETRLGFWWTPPRWDTFIDFSIFATQWQAFLHRTRFLFAPEKGRVSDHQRFAAFRFVFVLAAWFDNIRSVAGRGRGGWNWEVRNENGKLPLGMVVPPSDAASKGRPNGFREEAVASYLDYVRDGLDKLYQDSRGAASYGRRRLALAWLDQDVPLMLHPEFLPPFCLEHLGLREKLAKTELWKNHWQNSWPFIDSHRSMLIRETLRDSQDVQALEAEFSGDTQGRLALREWCLKACRDWEAMTRRHADLVRGTP
ncbi:hypothetical protein D7W82_25645 [Corallococcus sp. CA049B]|uniref:hypothetical protein n=1 Tax=Corallococcus sp. CA049B TaxID=2316730 RepID=UPI000EDF26C5|nr:hypothetical protein [Corallococcus sp. CA049B]RKG83112.1 hypothetical protein D7W82_25645 [Corallococcus sp. CA049B]